MEATIVKILIDITPEMSKLKMSLTQDWTWAKILNHGLLCAHYPPLPPQPIISPEDMRRYRRVRKTIKKRSRQ